MTDYEMGLYHATILTDPAILQELSEKYSRCAIVIEISNDTQAVYHIKFFYNKECTLHRIVASWRKNWRRSFDVRL